MAAKFGEVERKSDSQHDKMASTNFFERDVSGRVALSNLISLEAPHKTQVPM